MVINLLYLVVFADFLLCNVISINCLHALSLVPHPKYNNLHFFFVMYLIKLCCCLVYHKMQKDRSWMYNRLLRGRKSFVSGVFEVAEKFIQFACSKEEFKQEARLRYPCFRCQNCKYADVDCVKVHIYKHGFMEDYYQWISHGESSILPSEDTIHMTKH
ncbi:hypothetical protein M9H77_03412 [Catharanthus roseus]|uniref:Uncharacterized protein n=1 Tax=Catharanthus roseus TaxID=4058 RepID=A0ACC0CBM1_CATRO|nr:hypothetical protein M9H77_03412 [Catharanthus roseus]